MASLFVAHPPCFHGFGQTGPPFPCSSEVAKHMDIHSYRRQYAQVLYQYYAQGRELPPAEGRLRRNTYDRDAAERVSWSLGHNRF